MRRQTGTEAEDSGKRLNKTGRMKHGADRKIRKKANPDTTLPPMTGGGSVLQP